MVLILLLMFMVNMLQSVMQLYIIKTLTKRSKYSNRAVNAKSGDFNYPGVTLLTHTKSDPLDPTRF